RGDYHDMAYATVPGRYAGAVVGAEPRLPFCHHRATLPPDRATRRQYSLAGPTWRSLVTGKRGVPARSLRNLAGQNMRSGAVPHRIVMPAQQIGAEIARRVVPDRVDVVRVVLGVVVLD